jgi:hypothetical protein
MPDADDYLAVPASVLVAVFSGMTVGDGLVTEGRGNRLVYCKSARDTLLSGNGTDPMRGRKSIDARPPIDKSHGSTKPGPPPEEESGSHTPALSIGRQSQTPPETFPLAGMS